MLQQHAATKSWLSHEYRLMTYCVLYLSRTGISGRTCGDRALQQSGREAPSEPWQGFASTAEGVEKGVTLWCVAHLPQNRDVWALTGGDGSLRLFRYRYPDQRCACVQTVRYLMGLLEFVKPFLAEPVTLVFSEQRSVYAHHPRLPLGLLSQPKSVKV